jgi:hypothetical protein
MKRGRSGEAGDEVDSSLDGVLTNASKKALILLGGLDVRLDGGGVMRERPDRGEANSVSVIC